VVVAHLFGYPADIPGVQAIGDRFGARIIEDAAQGTGGLLQDRMLGAFGPLTVLSFGRGKGVTGGRGGALLTFDSESTLSVAQHRTLPSARRGWIDWSAAAAQWSVGRPNFYGLPAAIPALRLGETTYRDARAPRAMSRSAAAMLPVAFAEAPAAAVRRRATAEIYRVALESAAIARSIDPIRSGQSGFLRFPVMMDSARSAAPRLGIYRSYPVPLVDEPAARSVLTAGHRFACGFPGARDLANRLFTLPTHHLMSDLDIRMVCSWLASQ
jgi:dTDP-4-amino-4,6-dideoxygalactose transaminase